MIIETSVFLKDIIMMSKNDVKNFFLFMCWKIGE